jgi:hypothetical protein
VKGNIFVKVLESLSSPNTWPFPGRDKESGGSLIKKILAE